MEIAGKPISRVRYNVDKFSVKIVHEVPATTMLLSKSQKTEKNVCD